MSRARWSAGAVLAALVLAGCSNDQDAPDAGPVVKSSSQTPSATPPPTPTPTPTPKPTPKPTPTKPPAPAADCTGSFGKDGSFSFSGRQIMSTTDGIFSCGGGKPVQLERLQSAVRFYYGSKRLTLGSHKSGTLAGYRIRVSVANSRQASFTMDVI
ncbi:hypothetical protein E0H73_02560 [Kribbella pittospori]|uniref:Uncharacterized protein n=1 Tax=Kribbella pittospori TaxID=722689 RepID=A0A4V2MC62_9ACTN|nr:hypothetical protein [Kribbella pittospori]TCC65832.1 hypothetical protein E0H73_02560 [Kribbella pittospori]